MAVAPEATGCPPPVRAAAPQQRTAPEARSAQVWLPPAATAIAPEVTGVALDASTGDDEEVPVTWPASLAPQQRTAPPVRTTQACPVPFPTATAEEGSATAAGVSRVRVSPVPSWPEALAPQHRTEPSERSAQVNAGPAASAEAPQHPPAHLSSPSVQEYPQLPCSGVPAPRQAST